MDRSFRIHWFGWVGGGQERGLRSGTLPASLAVGFGEAARLALKEMEVRPRLERDGR